jgi:hypothetical protein
MFSGLSRSTSKPLLLAKKIFVLALASRATCRVTHLNEADTQVEAIYKMNQRNAFADARDQEAREMVYSLPPRGRACCATWSIARGWRVRFLYLRPIDPCGCTAN